MNEDRGAVVATVQQGRRVGRRPSPDGGRGDDPCVAEVCDVVKFSILNLILCGLGNACSTMIR